MHTGRITQQATRFGHHGVVWLLGQSVPHALPKATRNTTRRACGMPKTTRDTTRKACGLPKATRNTTRRACGMPKARLNVTRKACGMDWPIGSQPIHSKRMPPIGNPSSLRFATLEFFAMGCVKS